MDVGIEIGFLGPTALGAPKDLRNGKKRWASLFDIY